MFQSLSWLPSVGGTLSVSVLPHPAMTDRALAASAATPSSMNLLLSMIPDLSLRLFPLQKQPDHLDDIPVKWMWRSLFHLGLELRDPVQMIPDEPPDVPR